MSDDAKSLIAEQAQLATKRTNWDNWWQQIAERVMPSSATFTVMGEEGQKRTERIFSGKAITANERFSAVMDDLLTPRSQRWHRLACAHDDLADDQEVKEYFDQVNNILFTERYRPRANFASQKAEGYMSVGAFGNSCMFIDEEVGVGPQYISCFMKEIFWTHNAQRLVDAVYRRFPMTARNAVTMAKKRNWTLPAKIQTAAEKEPFTTFEFMHTVMPNPERISSRRDHRGMPFASYYMLLDGEQMLSAGGFTSFPFAIGRYMLGPSETYARSPAMSAWGAILTLHEEKKTILRAGQKEVDPPLLLTEDGVLDAFNLRPGALNYGAVTSEGQELVKPLKIGANIPLGLELMGLESQEIDDAFLNTIFKVLVENPQMTATQVLEIAQQRAVLLAPLLGRMDAEDLGPLIAREIDIAAKAGKLPPMPDVLREIGPEYKIEYQSPLARAMRAQDGVAILRTFEAMPGAIAIDPDAALVVDVPQSLREVAEINGMPAKLLRDPKVVAAMKAQKQQADHAAQAASMAPEMSQATLNAAKAEQLRTGT